MSANNSTKIFKNSGAIKKAFVMFVFFVSSFFFGNKLVAQENKPGIFYAVTGNGLNDTSWLFGTYHLVGSSYLNDVPEVKRALSKAKGIVVEIVTDSAEMQAAQQYGISKDQKLTDLLEKPFLDSLETELKNNIGVGIEQLNQLKPMNVTLTLSIVYLVKNNRERFQKYAGFPLDAFFASAAKQAGKNVTALETIKEQMNMLFNSNTTAEQVQGLKAFLRNKADMLKLGDDLVQSWFDHDLSRMNDIYKETLELSGEEDKLIKERNLNWIKVLPALMQKESQFVGVGALHLAGKFGLVNLLKQSGYTVTPVKL